MKGGQFDLPPPSILPLILEPNLAKKTTFVPILFLYKNGQNIFENLLSPPLMINESWDVAMLF